ncbi:MAG: glycosyl hydrolase family 57, partial [Candidatus Omnitrophica bacterium]|nr:glycosyl hydrolase family 57 [Candidatus Omnitrophota bacterium]MBD3269794.1 glycosyl hydrolase family 57 [Candidatus Omnitrophota bacterium]
GLKRKLYSSLSKIKPDKVDAAFGIALHMHQPTIPASEDDLESAALISNLQYMMEHQDIGDNYNAPVFLKCYYRMSDFIKELAGEGKNPRVMLDYSGNLLWGLEQIGQTEAIDKLKVIACDKKYYPYVEWLGTMWSHAVVSSTPVPDIKLHIESWRHHFASLFGDEALERVRGFSAPEMHLPIHPDICYEYVRALKEYGYRWLMVQEHTIEKTDASSIDNPYLPHKLVARNSLGEKEEIVALIKTQGSDTKLVGQMQPYYEAKTKGRQNYAGVNLFPYVLQIGDGENGGVMMNEFPEAYKKAFSEIGTQGTVSMNGSEYLEFIYNLGLKDGDLIEVQPVSQSKIWEFIDGFKAGAADRALEKLKEKYPDFSLEKASWTNDKNWVKGYKDVMDPVNKLSVEFHKLFDKRRKIGGDNRYGKALLYLLLSQTSCFRYWGKGLWTDYAKEICRRGMEVLGK